MNLKEMRAVVDNCKFHGYSFNVTKDSGGSFIFVGRVLGIRHSYWGTFLSTN
jgi:hypothetical protein